MNMKRRLHLLSLFFATISSYAQYATFTPQVYKPVQQDYSILQRSLEQIEQRKNEANEQFSRLQLLLAEYGAKLHNDETTLIWFDEYKKHISESFYTLSTIEWGDARDYAIRKQGEIATDPELVSRIRTANEYIERCNAIEERTDMNWKEKDEWKTNNPYCYVPIKNSEGKVVGGRLGSKSELEEQIREAEIMRREAEERARQLEEMERKRIYNMEHPFDNYDYSKYEIVVSYPPCKKCPEGMIVTKVALSQSETRVEVEAIAYYPWVCIAWDTYIKTSGNENLRIVNANNIAFSPSKTEFKKPGEKLKFALIFPPLPPKAKTFSIIEPVKNGFRFKDIKFK